MIKLYGIDVSGNTYKARLLMNILNIEYQQIPVDMQNQAHKSPFFLKLNPRGEIPVLVDEKTVIWDSQAILIYLARKYNAESWHPDNAIEMAKISQWLSVANNEIANTLAKARAIIKFSYSGCLEDHQEQAKGVLAMINQHLENQQTNSLNWLVGDKPSIADLACYPYIALSHEGGISLEGYTAIHKWIEQVQNLQGYINMPGLPFSARQQS